MTTGAKEVKKKKKRTDWEKKKKSRHTDSERFIEKSNNILEAQAVVYR